MEEIFLQTRDAAYQIIKCKGATYYAVAAGLMRITQAILRDQSTVLSVSSLIQDYYGISDVYFSLPTVINRRGVRKGFRLELSPEEIDKLRHSAEHIKSRSREAEASTKRSVLRARCGVLSRLCRLKIWTEPSQVSKESLRELLGTIAKHAKMKM